MKVKELRELLEDYDENMTVVVYNKQNEFDSLIHENISEEEVLEDTDWYWDDPANRYDDSKDQYVLVLGHSEQI